MVIDRISLILVIIGALNWGSIGLFSFDFVAWLRAGGGGQPHCVYAGGAGGHLVHFAFIPPARGRSPSTVKETEKSADRKRGKNKALLFLSFGTAVIGRNPHADSRDRLFPLFLSPKAASAVCKYGDGAAFDDSASFFSLLAFCYY